MEVNIEGASIHVETAGQGSPVLLLHGVPDSSEMWRGVVEQLSLYYRCYAPDLPGFNLSEIPSNYQYDLPHYGQFVKQLLDALGIQEPVRLVLHDWGGIFGMSFACQFPERVAGIVGGSFPFTAQYRWHAWARIWRTPILGELAMLGMTKALFKWEVNRGGGNISQKHIDSTYAKLEWKTRQNMLRLYRSADPEKLKSFEAALAVLAEQVPIDLIWGNDDIYVAPRFGKFLNPRTQINLEGCGHWVPVEAPLSIAEMMVPG